MDNNTDKVNVSQAVSKIFETHLEDLRRSGLSDETIAGSGIVSMPGSVLSKHLGFQAPGDGYSIPYSPDYTRFKIFGGEKKYLAPVGSGVYVYVPFNLPKVFDTLVVTEGEKKALKACQEGIAAIAIGGVDMWSAQLKEDRAPTTIVNKDGEVVVIYPKTVETPVLPAILKLCEGKRVVVLADSDAADNQKVRRAMQLLAQAIAHQVSCAAVQYKACPHADTGAKQGLDDWILSAGSEAVSAALNDAARGYPYMPYRFQIPYAPAPDGVVAHKGMLYYRLAYDIAGQPFLPKWTKDKVVETGGKDDKHKEIVHDVLHGVPYCWVSSVQRIAQTNGEHIISTENVREAEVFKGVTDSRNPSLIKILSDAMDDKKFWRGYGFDNANVPVWQQILVAQKQAGMIEQRLAVTKKGWVQYQGCRFYGYGEDTMLASQKAIEAGVHVELFTRSNSGRQISGCGQNGTFEGERDVFRTKIFTTPAMAALVGFTASAPILSLLGAKAEAGIIHLFGASGHGKSTVQKAAAALIGNPGKAGEAGSYGQSWNSTQNGMESPLESKDDGFVVLDELHQLPKNTDTLALLYMAANGAGKKRMTKEIEERMNKGWTTQILSSGEISFRARLAMDGYKDMPGGLQFRTIDLPIGDVPYLQNWTGADVMRLEHDLQAHHGHAWPLLIKFLMENRDLVVKLFEQIDSDLEKCQPAGASRIFERRRKHIAASMLGLTCLCHIYQIPSPEAAQIRAAAKAWAVEHLWPAGLDNVVGDESTNMLAALETWVVSNSSRFIRSSMSIPPRDAVGAADKSGHVFIFEKGGIQAIAGMLSLDSTRLKAALLSAGWERVQKRASSGGVRLWSYKSPEAMLSAASEEDL